MTLHTPSLVSAPASTSAHSLSNKAEALSLRHRLLFLMFVGDTFAAYGGLCLAYWLRFVSPLSGIGVGAGGGSSRDFMAYQPVIALGVLFLHSAEDLRLETAFAAPQASAGYVQGHCFLVHYLSVHFVGAKI